MTSGRWSTTRGKRPEDHIRARWVHPPPWSSVNIRTEAIFDYILVSMWQMNKFMPVDHFVAALSLIVTFWAAVLAYRGGKWLIGVVRGSGTQ